MFRAEGSAKGRKTKDDGKWFNFEWRVNDYLKGVGWRPAEECPDSLLFDEPKTTLFFVVQQFWVSNRSAIGSVLALAGRPVPFGLQVTHLQELSKDWCSRWKLFFQGKHMEAPSTKLANLRLDKFFVWKGRKQRLCRIIARGTLLDTEFSWPEIGRTTPQRDCRRR